MDLVKLGKILKEKRDELGLSLRGASKLIGISHNYLAILEKANDPRSDAPITPTIETLDLISKAYFIDIDLLLKLSGYEDIEIKKPNDSNIKSDDLINHVREEAEKYGLDIDVKDKSNEELAKLIVKALRIDEINKSN